MPGTLKKIELRGAVGGTNGLLVELVKTVNDLVDYVATHQHSALNAAPSTATTNLTKIADADSKDYQTRATVTAPA